MSKPIPIPFPVSLLSGQKKISYEIKSIIKNCSAYLKHYMPEKNEQLTAHVLHLSMCTGISEKTIAKIFCDEKKERAALMSMDMNPRLSTLKPKQSFKRTDEFLKQLVKRKIYTHHKNNTVMDDLLC